MLICETKITKMNTAFNTSYKGQEIYFDYNKNLVEFIVDDLKLNDLESYVFFITILVEYCEINKPDYVVINKENSDFALSPEMHDYTRRVIFSSLKSFSVKNLIMLVKSVYYDKIYRHLNPESDFLIGFASREEMYEWIKKKENA